MVLMAVATTLVTGCAQRMTQEAGGDVVLDSRDAGGAWTSNIRGTGGWEWLRGSAFAQLVDQGTRISLTLERALAGSNYAWNVREGSCAAPGRIFGDSTAYTPIFAGEDGRDAIVVDLAQRLEPGKTYIVNLYSRELERASTIACGALRQ
jgi:hypothetical protein